MVSQLAIDLFCGLGGWAEGFLAEGYRVVGFDIERHDYGTGGYPAQLVIQDVTTLHGSQFRDAAVIVASPPCQAYSYRAMPWKKAKALPPPDNTLFESCFRIQREACEAAGRHIPLIVENVRGAQPWVGRAKANFGSYYLWGDVGMVGRRVVAGPLRFGGAVQPLGRLRKTPEGSWDLTRKNYNPNHSWEAHKQPGRNFHFPEKYGIPSPSFHGHGEEPSVLAAMQMTAGVKGFTPNGEPLGKNTLGRKHGSKSKARKAASAMIAKIPFPLACYIARCFREPTKSIDRVPGRNPFESISGDAL